MPLWEGINVHQHTELRAGHTPSRFKGKKWIIAFTLRAQNQQEVISAKNKYGKLTQKAI